VALSISKFVNLKGDLFATAASFGAQAVIKLGSSLILTRILRPEAYGIITILMSVTFVIELIGDINVTLFIIRDKNSEEPRYLNTAWTLQLARAVLDLVCRGRAAIDVVSNCNPAQTLTHYRVLRASSHLLIE
jgi:hypothetical protein